MRVFVAIGFAALAAPAMAQATISDEVLDLWAKNAVSLEDYVEKGFGLSEPKDAKDPQWCAYQANTVSLMYSNNANCAALIAKMREIGRIK